LSTCISYNKGHEAILLNKVIILFFIGIKKVIFKVD